MRDKIALVLLAFGSLVFAAKAPVTTFPSTINVTAEIEVMNGKIIRPSLVVKEGEWGTIDLDGVGVKIRTRRQGNRFVKTDYQLFLVNGKNKKTWKQSHVVASWSQRMAAHVPTDKNSRVRRLALTSSLMEDGLKK